MEERYTRLSSFAQELLTKDSLTEGLRYIASSVKTMLPAERASIFIYDKKANRVWTTHADNAEQIVVPYDLGIVGDTIRTQKVQLENEPYDNPNFFSESDIETGYYTKNILAAPIFNSAQEVIGVLQLLNKRGGFDKEDKAFISFFAHYISGFIELADLSEERAN